MIRSNYLYIGSALVVLGLVLGYVWWFNWGCLEACPIDSSWKMSMLRGGLIGLCIALIFAPTKKKPNSGNDSEEE